MIDNNDHLNPVHIPCPPEYEVKDEAIDEPSAYFDAADWPEVIEPQPAMFILTGPEPEYRRAFGSLEQLREFNRSIGLFFHENPLSSYIQFNADGGHWRVERITN